MSPWLNRSIIGFGTALKSVVDIQPIFWLRNSPVFLQLRWYSRRRTRRQLSASFSFESSPSVASVCSIRSRWHRSLFTRGPT